MSNVQKNIYLLQGEELLKHDISASLYLFASYYFDRVKKAFKREELIFFLLSHTLSKIYPHWNWNSKLNSKLRLEFQVEYGFKLEFQVE